MIPSEYGFAFDFWDLWHFGRAALSGIDPWSLKQSFYPPAAVYFIFTTWAIFPIAVGYFVLAAESIIALVVSSGRKAIPLLLFFPVAASLGQGQIGLLFLPLILLLRRNDWKSVVAAVLITLKPQIALVVLPWYFFRWRRGMVAGFVVGSLALHLSPLIINPSSFTAWIGSLADASANKASMAAGVWQLPAPTLLLIAISVVAAALAIRHKDEKTARAALAFFNPVLSYYDTAFLWDCAPLPLLIGSGALALGLSHYFNSFLPFTLISGSVLAYRLIKSLTIPALRSRIRIAEGERVINAN